MSIATLKKKTQDQYNNMSVGSKHGFSLNGTHRSQGYVGQTMLSRSLPRTLMKGNVPKGHGGCCGTFPIQPIIQSAVTSLNNPNIVKPSVINTFGMINTRYRWFHCDVVKPSPSSNTYIRHQDCNIVKKDVSQTPKKCANVDSYHKTPICTYTKPEANYVARTAGHYIEGLAKQCMATDASLNSYFPTHNQRTPFAGST